VRPNNNPKLPGANDNGLRLSHVDESSCTSSCTEGANASRSMTWPVAHDSPTSCKLNAACNLAILVVSLYFVLQENNHAI
jgi:hypothetical protein